MVHPVGVRSREEQDVGDIGGTRLGICRDLARQRRNQRQRVAMERGVPLEDTRWTEFMDYTSANLLMFSALYCVLVRTFELDNRRSAGLFFAFFAWLVSHVRMVNNPPDRSVESYRWEVNMRVMMTIAVAHWAIVLPWAYGCRLRRGGFGSGTGGGCRTLAGTRWRSLPSSGT